MKSATCITTLYLFAVSSICLSATESPERILAEYREKEASELAALNSTLEQASIPLIAELVRTGDTASANLVKNQLEAKISGTPVPNPHKAAAKLFQQYDSARAKALEPLKQASLRRISSLLNSSEGKKLDVVSALAQVRADIESDSALPTGMIPSRWTYHTTEFGKPMGELNLNKDGTFDLLIPTSSSPKETGTWKPSRKQGVLNLICRNERWTVVIQGDAATLERPTITGIRHLKRQP
jgi:hypothetical protein